MHLLISPKDFIQNEVYGIATYLHMYYPGSFDPFILQLFSYPLILFNLFNLF